MNVSSRTLEDLAFDEVRRAFIARCRTEPGRTRAAIRPFLDTREAVEHALAVIEEARRLRVQELALPLSEATEIRPNLVRAGKGAMLEPRELLPIAQSLFAFARTHDALLERAEVAPLLSELGRKLPQLGALAQRLDSAFDPSGELSDRASPALKEARDRVRGLHRTMKSRLETMLADERFQPNLRESYFSVRNDRYVLPIVAQHRAQVPGIVHNASQSGQTLFIEPEALTGLGNELAIAQSLVLEEERRILQELSNAVGKHEAAITAGIETIAELDEAEAAGLLADDLRATPPTVEDAEGPLELLQMRHPLLAISGRDVVANDVRLSGESRALIISGPNAGGKTVTLTGVGLCALMLRCGLPVPAATGSRLPLYHSVHSTIGDAQDLNQALSTFSAHVLQLRDIVANATRGSLALVDEIAADTDPKEGAALAVAVLEDLLNQGVVVLVTTHLEELKALAHVDKRFVNARVGFDAKKMMPTYRLQLGVAGASSAIEVASRMGLPPRIIERARERVRGAGGPLTQALEDTERQRAQLSEAMERARAETEAAQTERATVEKERAELERRRRDEETQFRTALREELENARSQIRDLLAALRKKETVRDLEAAQREVAERAEEQTRAINATRAETARASQPDRPADIRVGGWVHHVGLAQDVQILTLDGNIAVVTAGALKTRVPVAELAPAHKDRQPSRFPGATDRKQKRMERAEAAAPAPVDPTSVRCDVRGLRADDALREVEQFLDRVFREGKEAALIVHGHGTGALKQSIRDYLDGSPYVRIYRPGATEEGGDGVTVIAFRT